MYGKYSEMYSQWCDYYDFENIELQTIGKYVRIDGKDIIDIGCGTGRFLFRILPYVHSAIGVDNDDISITVLKNLLSQQYKGYVSQTTIICSNIEDVQITSESIDIAFFSWSLYALNKEQMNQAIRKVFDMLRANGKLIILQPIGGEFETVMRQFFKEHEDEDEYRSCLDNMNEIIPPLFNTIAADKIVSHFVVPDLNEFCEILKMFAVTEGGCVPNELNHISWEILNNLLSSYKREDGFWLEDEVSLFVYEKRVFKSIIVNSSK